MTVKEHYDLHLGYFYSWMAGDFQEKKNHFLQFCRENNLNPRYSKVAIDLGAGNGIQSIALAELGFLVKAIDFNARLLSELALNKNELPVELIHDDIKTVSKFRDSEPELVVCCGDTISHLDSAREIKELIKDIFNVLTHNGLLVLTFRDYSVELEDTSRFIPVKNDPNRILTCFLEFSSDKVKVTDILYERENGQWQQKASSYEKVRITENIILSFLKETGFEISFNKTVHRLVAIIAKKPVP